MNILTILLVIGVIIKATYIAVAETEWGYFNPYGIYMKNLSILFLHNKPAKI